MRTILIIVFVATAAIGVLLFSLIYGWMKSDYSPTPQWAGKCNQIPKAYSFPFGEQQINGPCALRPESYPAFLASQSPEKIARIFPVSHANSIGVQFSNDLNMVTLGAQKLQLVIANSGRQSGLYDTILQSYSHTIDDQSMLFTKQGVMLFDPVQKSRKIIAQSEQAFPIKPNFIFTIDHFVEREVDFFGRPVYERKTDSLKVGVTNLNGYEDERELLLPYTSAFTSAHKMFFHCHGNTIRVFNDTLKEVTHPISKLVKTIPGIDSLKIFSIHVHSLLPLAFVRVGNDMKKVQGSDWLWMLHWPKGKHRPARQICERAIPHGFSPDVKWFHFSQVVQGQTATDGEQAHFIFSLSESFIEREPILSAPIKLLLPIIPRHSSEAGISDFTWVTEPMGLTLLYDDKVLRWTFPEY